jgi:hypothetical protein
MRRLLLWIIVALLTFAVGIACVLWFLDHSSVMKQSSAVSSVNPASSEPADLPFCKLVAAPENYEGKIVRVHAAIIVGIHGAVLRDDACSSMQTQVWVYITPAMWDELKRAMEAAYAMKDVNGPLDVIAVGRFDKNHRPPPEQSSDTLEDNAPYRFELMQIEKAARLYRAQSTPPDR